MTDVTVLRVFERPQPPKQPTGRSPAGLAAFFDPGATSRKATEVVGPSTSNLALPCDFKGINERRAEKEDPLHAYAVGHTSYREGRAGSRRVALGVATLEDDALESLNTLAFTFTNHHVDTNGVTGLKILDGVTRSCFN